MDKLTKIIETTEKLEDVKRFLLYAQSYWGNLDDRIETVKTAILLLSDYAKWYDYKTSQRELYELIGKEE